MMFIFKLSLLISAKWLYVTAHIDDTLLSEDVMRGWNETVAARKALSTNFSTRITERTSDECAYDIGACINAERAIYESTPLKSAEILHFFQNSIWKDPNFDLAGFFSSLAFKSQCRENNGEVFKLHIQMDCPSSPRKYLENFRFCAPLLCNDFEYALLKSYTISIVGEVIGCDMKGISNTVTPINCLSSYERNYYGTDLEKLSPELFLSKGGGQNLEADGHCKDTFQSGDVKVCNMQSAKDIYQYITSACESEEINGEVFHIDLTMDGKEFHRTIRKYPICKPKNCSGKDILTYYKYVADNFQENNIDLRIYKSISSKNSCDEEINDKAFMRIIDRKPQIESCKWLYSRKRKEKIDKYCKKNFKAGGVEPAKVICPATCCSCKERSSNLFLVRAEINVDGFLTIEKETCEWLQNASVEVREYHCNEKDSATYVGGYPPAYIACPKTCNNCNP